MSWNIEIPIIVRTLINDLGDQPVYSDERIQQVIAVAAKYVQTDSTEIAGNGAGNISFYSVGSSLTQTEVDDFDNALRIFLESIGRLNPA